MVSKYLKYSVLALSVAALLSGCGGGSSNEVSTSQKGRAVDGPLSGALVTFQTCTDIVETNEDGFFDIPNDCQNQAITISGGIDTATGLEFKGILKAKAPESTTATAIVSPLTTLVSAGATDQQVRDLLGITDNSVDIALLDPMSNQDVYAKAVAVQELAEQIQKVVSTLGGTYSDAQLNTAAFAAIVNALKTSTITPDSLTNQSIIEEAIKKTVTSDEIQSALPVNFKGEEVAENLAKLSAQVIKKNVDQVETAIKAADNFTAEGLLAESNDVKSAKASPVAENLVRDFSNILTQDNETVKDLIEKIAEYASTAPEDRNAADMTSITEELDRLKITVPENALSGLETIKVKKYTNLEFGAYSLDLLKGSTLSKPLYVGFNDDIFKQELVIKSENMSNNRDTIKLAFKVKILNSNNSEIGSMNGIIDQVVLSFGDNGQINKAALPTNTNLELNATLLEGGATATKSKNHIVQSPIELTIDDQNKLSLEALLNSDSRFASTYADYAHHLDGTYKFDTTIYIKSNNLQIDNANLTSNAIVDFGATKYRFEGYSINAFFNNY